MILAILFVLMFAGGLGIMFALVVLAIGYRDMARRATQAANMNAGYWAQAQERTALVEAYNERMSEHLTENQKLLVKMTDHAREALKLAQIGSGKDDRMVSFTCPFCAFQKSIGSGEAMRMILECPSCGKLHPAALEREDDSILNAREIDG